MHMRCVDDTVGVGNDRQHSGLGHPDEAESELSAPKMEGSWKVDQIKMLSGVGSDRIPRLNFVAGAGFEPATSGRDQGPGPDYCNSWVPLENLGFLRRFPIGRLQLYRNVLGQMPTVSDDISMTCRIRRCRMLAGLRHGSTAIRPPRSTSSLFRTSVTPPIGVPVPR